MNNNNDIGWLFFGGYKNIIALDANNISITLVFDLGNIVNISGKIFLYPPQGQYYISVNDRIMNKCSILLINIYGPNLDSPQFYSDINDIICASTSDFYIICGDFNLVQEFELDCLNYKNLNNPRTRNKLLESK